MADKAQAGVTNVDLFDDRKAKEAGFDIIYEARDLSLPQSTRDGIDQFRGDVAATKTRFAESSRRVNTELGAMVDKSYWCAHLSHLTNPCTFRAHLVKEIAF